MTTSYPPASPYRPRHAAPETSGRHAAPTGAAPVRPMPSRPAHAAGRPLVDPRPMAMQPTPPRPLPMTVPPMRTASAQAVPAQAAPMQAAQVQIAPVPMTSVPPVPVPTRPVASPLAHSFVPMPATGLTMKRRNPLAVWLGLPLVTLGIYTLVWYYEIHREMAEFDRRRQAPVAGPLLVLLLLSWTVVAPLVSFFNTGKRIAEAQRAAGLRPTANPWLGLVLCFVFGLQTLYYQAELNKVVDAYGAPEGTTVTLAG